MLELSVPDMTCGGCKAAVEKALRPLAAPAEVTVDLTRRQVAFHGSVDAARMIAALDSIGFPATVAP
jgi:copper chaperone